MFRYTIYTIFRYTIYPMLTMPLLSPVVISLSNISKIANDQGSELSSSAGATWTVDLASQIDQWEISRILKWRYCSIFLAIFWVYIPLHRPYIGLIHGRYLKFGFLEWPLKDWKRSSKHGANDRNDSSKQQTYCPHFPMVFPWFSHGFVRPNAHL